MLSLTTGGELLLTGLYVFEGAHFYGLGPCLLTAVAGCPASIRSGHVTVTGT